MEGSALEPSWNSCSVSFPSAFCKNTPVTALLYPPHSTAQPWRGQWNGYRDPRGVWVSQGSQQQLRPCVGGARSQDAAEGPMASPRSLGHRVKHPHLVHHGKNPIHPLLWCVFLLGKLHCVSLQQQDRTRSHTHCALPAGCPQARIVPTHPTSGQGARGPEPPSATRSRHCPGHDGHDGHNPPPCKRRNWGCFSIPQGSPGAALSLPLLPPSDKSHPQCPASRSS